MKKLLLGFAIGVLLMIFMTGFGKVDNKHEVIDTIHNSRAIRVAYEINKNGIEDFIVDVSIEGIKRAVIYIREV